MKITDCEEDRDRIIRRFNELMEANEHAAQSLLRELGLNQLCDLQAWDPPHWLEGCLIKTLEIVKKEPEPDPVESFHEPVQNPLMEGINAAISFSRGESKYDNCPDQREVASFDDLADAVLNDRSAEKGKIYICAPFAKGYHNNPEKYAGEATWRQKRLAQGRCFLPFDIDGVDCPETAHKVMEYLKRYQGFAYTTSSHTQEAPRFRVVLAQTRETDPEEDVALGKGVQALIEAELGKDKIKFDQSVYGAAQPLFTPLHGAGDFRFTGQPVDVDVMLAQAPTKLSASTVQATAAKQRTAKAPLETAKTDDPILRILNELDMVRGDQGGGKFNIECPYAHEHTMDGGEGETVYYQAHTGGYAQAHIHCLHGHCAERKTNEFMAALGARYAQETGKQADWDVNKLVDFNNQGKPAGVAPLQAKHLITDQANAVRLQKAVGGSVIHTAGKWRVWDGTHWREDEPAAFRLTCTLSSMIDAEATEWETKPYTSNEERDRNKAVAGALRKWSTKSEMLDRLNAAFNLLRRLVTVPADSLDSDPYALNVANGTIDLRTGELHPHDKDDLITHCIPIPYDPKAEAPTFKRVLSEIAGGSKALVDFFQRWFGYGATGVTSEQKFAVHHGDGANGKSLLLDTVSGVLGSYAGTAAPGLLMDGGQNRHPAEVADLFGMRLVAAHESGEGALLNEDRIKQATGSDKLKARHMRQDFFEFSPTHTLNLLTNHKPQIRGQDLGIWRRVMLIPYGVTFGTKLEVEQGLAHHLRDDHLYEALKVEAAGILTWIVRGAVQWYMTGLRPPDIVLAAGAEYRSEQDRVGQFISECCKVGPEQVMPCDVTYDDYKEWALACGYRPLAKMRFCDAVEKRPGITKGRARIQWLGNTRQCECFTGLSVLSKLDREV
ncbi:phage/plasmid primase, P4 family [Pseudomonas sp. LS1212]|uniref:DNA primase family protein n=1 Tax=Pseudomonas sp. LS1212 TaxID=2972478 RepID=UPI00215B7AFE|nr:phage/plasmid primase, P4 family [Pseudomonas sp. LS1212]UVJ44991.1 phage/plasmid primase, P4 family [Pseudomonas sp. LS1212]